MNKKITILIVVLIAVFAISLFGMLYFSINYFVFGEFSFKDTTSRKLVEKVEYDKLKNINIEFEACDVEILEKDIDSIIVEFYLNTNSIHSATEDKNSINIMTKVISKNILFNKEPKVIIYVPNNYKKTITITGNAGNINIGNIPNMELDIKVDAGDINIERVSRSNIVVDAGNIDIENVYNYININCNAGNISINDLNIEEDSKIELNMGLVTINKTNSINIKPTINIGNISIKKNNSNSNTNLLINVNAGNIEVG